MITYRPAAAADYSRPPRRLSRWEEPRSRSFRPRRRAARRGTTSRPTSKNVDWRSTKAKGARFVYAKATESTTYRNPYFSRQHNGSRAAGLVRGAYHFALPNRSSGQARAAHFVRNDGGWTSDGWTLPPALDIEYHPCDKKHKCYGLSKARMVSWIKSFSGEVKRLTGRHPVIYTTTHWWNTCTGDSRAFARNHPCGSPATTLRARGRCRPAGPPGPSGSTTTATAPCRVIRISSTGHSID